MICQGYNGLESYYFFSIPSNFILTDIHNASIFVNTIV